MSDVVVRYAASVFGLLGLTTLVAVQVPPARRTFILFV